MKISTIALAVGLIAVGSVALAEGGAPSGQGSTTGDPAASSQNANPNTTGMSPSKSGSGTSTSGGSDANGDQGRDKCRTAASVSVHMTSRTSRRSNPRRNLACRTAQKGPELGRLSHMSTHPPLLRD
jgi:hypothetical protein